MASIDSATYRSFKTLFDPLLNPALKFTGLRFTVQAESLNFTARNKSRNALHI